MKWVHFARVPMYINKNGKTRESEAWVSTEEMIADSGRRKGIRMMDMTISTVPGMFVPGLINEPDELLYLHFKGQEPNEGILIAYISESEVSDYE